MIELVPANLVGVAGSWLRVRQDMVMMMDFELVGIETAVNLLTEWERNLCGPMLIRLPECFQRLLLSVNVIHRIHNIEPKMSDREFTSIMSRLL